MSEERVERRLTAILAADVVGYSRLMGVDEEGGFYSGIKLLHEITPALADAVPTALGGLRSH